MRDELLANHNFETINSIKLIYRGFMMDEKRTVGDVESILYLVDL